MTGSIITDIVDVAHHETACIPALAKAKAAGLVAVIAKCTQGVGYLDPAYGEFRDECKRLDLLFASYAFGSGAHPGAEQAKHFLGHADPDSLLCLDWEWQQKDEHGKPKFPEMTTKHAEDFVEYVHAKTGRFPLVYSSASWVNECKPKPAPSSILASCPLWVCWYGNGVPGAHLPQPWKAFDLWQYTNGRTKPFGVDAKTFPVETPKLGAVDRSAFMGDAAALREWWKNCGRDRGPACRDV